MKKICINNKHFDNMLTLDKAYEILNQVGNQYLIMTDNGGLFYIDSKRFK